MSGVLFVLSFFLTLWNIAGCTSIIFVRSSSRVGAGGGCSAGGRQRHVRRSGEWGRVCSFIPDLWIRTTVSSMPSRQLLSERKADDVAEVVSGGRLSVWGKLFKCSCWQACLAPVHAQVSPPLAVLVLNFDLLEKAWCVPALLR